MEQLPHLDLATALLVAILAIYMIAKQFVAKPVGRFSFVIMPLLALYEACESYENALVSGSQAIECVVLVGLAIAAAFIQAKNTEVFFEEGVLYTRSKIVAVVTWVVFIVVRLGMHQFIGSAGWITWLAIAVVFGARTLFLLVEHPQIGSALASRSGAHRRRC